MDETNASRARDFVISHVGCDVCLAAPLCHVCARVVELLERELNLAEDRGREENERRGNA